MHTKYILQLLPGTDPEINQGGWLAYRFQVGSFIYCEHYIIAVKFKDMKWGFTKCWSRLSGSIPPKIFLKIYPPEIESESSFD